MIRESSVEDIMVASTRIKNLLTEKPLADSEDLPQTWKEEDDAATTTADRPPLQQSPLVPGSAPAPDGQSLRMTRRMAKRKSSRSVWWSEQLHRLSVSDLRMDDVLERRRSLRIQMTHGRTSGDRLERASRIAASLLPDEILLDVHTRGLRSFNAVLMLGDVSGFTDLTERYSMSGRGGTSRLTSILNLYIGSMVQEILEHGGDVLKFSGDAFLVMWKIEEGLTMQDCVTRALDAACEIQKFYGTRATDVGVLLGVKLAISSGFAQFSIIGDDESKNYVLVGDPLWEVKEAEHVCSKGDVMVTMHAWQVVNTRDYDHEVLHGGRLVRVLGVGQTWTRVQRPMRSQAPRRTDDASSVAGGDSTGTGVGAGASERGEPVALEELTLRPAVGVVLACDMLPLLRPFLIRPVLRGLDLDEPLEYLTEMRQVVIAMVNVVIKSPVLEAMIAQVDKCFRITCRHVDAMQGSVNKATLFDKDLMILIIFGLRGFKTARESQIALRCSADVRAALMELEMVQAVSVGVTSGSTYCGVVGHPYRREYTVIGVPVNKAARLMMSYPNKVTCDKDSYLYSKLDATHFQLQPVKDLKGIRKVGAVYEFKEKVELRDPAMAIWQCYRWPLLGRRKELKAYATLLTTMARRRVAERRIVDEGATPQEQLKWTRLRKNTLVIGAEPRQGKSRLLNELLWISTELPVYRVMLTQRDAAVPYSGMRHLLLGAMHLLPHHTRNEREATLEELLGSVGVERDYMCVMNPVLEVAFPVTYNFRRLSPPERLLAQKLAVERLSLALFAQLSVVGVDDAEFLDRDSWRLLRVLVDLDAVFLVLTLSTRIGMMSREAQEVLCMRWRVHRLHLAGLDKWYHAGLACQLLDVWAVPPELEKVLQQHSGGNPGWIESYLINLVQGGALTIKMLRREDVEKAGLVTPPLYMLTRAVSPPLHEEEYLNLGGARGDRWAMYFPTFTDSDIDSLKVKRHSEKPQRQASEETTTATIATITTASQKEGVVVVGVKAGAGAGVAAGAGAAAGEGGAQGKSSEAQEPRQYLEMPKLVAVCVRAHKEKLDEPDAAFGVNVLILQTLDALNPFEQLLLKCSSVIGNTFQRKMLLSMLGAVPYQRDVAMAVKRLFEIHVLECASRNAVPGIRPPVVSPATAGNGPSHVVDDLCECPMVDFLPEISDLPTYAHCQYMRFRTSQYRDTTYSLLTESQRLVYHGAAVAFIEANARRCTACGNRYFPRGLAPGEGVEPPPAGDGAEQADDDFVVEDLLKHEEPHVELDIESVGSDDRPNDFMSTSGSRSLDSDAESQDAPERENSEAEGTDVHKRSSESWTSVDDWSSSSLMSSSSSSSSERDDWEVSRAMNDPRSFQMQKDFKRGMLVTQLLVNSMTQKAYEGKARHGKTTCRKRATAQNGAQAGANSKRSSLRGLERRWAQLRDALARSFGRRRSSLPAPLTLRTPVSGRDESEWLSSFSYKDARRRPDGYPDDFSRFSILDFRECKCNQILSTTYDSLIRHSLGASMSDKMMDMLLNYADLCMEMQNQPLALRLLRDALVLLREQARLHAQMEVKALVDSEDEVTASSAATPKRTEPDSQLLHSIPKFKMPYVYGRVHFLLGQSRLGMGQEEESLPELLCALQAFGCSWPGSQLGVRLRLPVVLLRLQKLLGRLRSDFPPLRKGFSAAAAVHESRCFCLLSDLFLSRGKHLLAAYAAARALNRSLEVSRGWTTLCGPLARMMEASQRSRNWRATRALEREALRLCRSLRLPTDAAQMRAAGHLFAAVARLRGQRGEMADSQEIGTTALGIVSAVADNQKRCEMLVLLVETLIQRGEVEEAAMFLHQLEYFSTEQDATREDTMWYYALCSFVFVIAGIYMTPLQQLVHFANKSRARILRETEHGPGRRLAVSHWVWRLRCEEWASAMVWRQAPPRHDPSGHMDIRDAITEALRLEGLLLLLVHHVNDRNVVAACDVAKEIRNAQREMRRVERRLPVLRPTLLLLRGYWRRVTRADKSALELVQRGRALAVRQGNRLCAGRCLLSEQAWTGEATDEEVYAWRDHSDCTAALHWKDVVFYGVPLPLPVLPPPARPGPFQL